MRVIVSALVAAAVLIAGHTAPANAQNMGRECRQLYQEYKSKAGFRAFALSRNRAGCAWSGGYGSQSDADRRAMTGCTNTRNGSCFIYTNTTREKAAEAEREQRKDVQRALNKLGHDAGSVDGVFGPGTRRAISRYQASIGAAQTGKLSDAQEKRLLNTVSAAAQRKSDQERALRDATPRERTVLGHSRDASPIARDLAGRWLAATADKTGGLDIWHMTTGTILLSIESAVVAAAFDAPGNYVAYVTGDGVLTVLDLRSGDLVFERKLDSSAPRSAVIALAPGAQEVALQLDGDAMTLWNTATGQSRSMANLRAARSAVYHPDGGSLFVTNADTGAARYDLATGRIWQRFLDDKAVDALRLSADGNRMVMKAGQFVTAFRAGGGTYVQTHDRRMGGQSIDIAPDGTEFALTFSGNAQRFDMATLKGKAGTQRAKTTGAFRGVWYTGTGNRLVLGSKNNALWLFTHSLKDSTEYVKDRGRVADAVKRQAATVKAAAKLRETAAGQARMVARAAFRARDCAAFAEFDAVAREGRTAETCEEARRVDGLQADLAAAEADLRCLDVASLSRELSLGTDRTRACEEAVALKLNTDAFNAALAALDCDQVAQLGPILNKPDAEAGCQFAAAMAENSDRKMFFAAVKYDSSNDRARARALYSEIMDRFPDSDLALQAALRLTALNDLEVSEEQAREAEAALQRQQAEIDAARREAERAARDAEAARKRAQDAERAAARQAVPKPAPVNSACNHVYRGYYFRTTQRKVNTAADFLSTVVGGAVMGVHFHVQGVNRSRGVATACSSDSGKCIEFRCSEIP